MNCNRIALFSIPFILISILLFSSCKTTQKIDKIEAAYYLVRHAEKVQNAKDPGLTKEGKERAYFLAEWLSEIPLDAIYSSDYFRTRKTAQPTCSAKNIQMQLYDPRDLKGFAKSIQSKHKKENVLIVGHSNTTPQLSNLLSNSTQFGSLEEWQYDKLYKIEIYSSGMIKKEVIQFGRKSAHH